VVIVLPHLVCHSPVGVLRWGVVIVIFIVGARIELGGGGVTGQDACGLLWENVVGKGYFCGIAFASFFRGTGSQNAGGRTVAGVGVIVGRNVDKNKLRHDEMILFIGFIV